MIFNFFMLIIDKRDRPLSFLRTLRSYRWLSSVLPPLTVLPIGWQTSQSLPILRESRLFAQV